MGPAENNISLYAEHAVPKKATSNLDIQLSPLVPSLFEKEK